MLLSYTCSVVLATHVAKVLTSHWSLDMRFRLLPLSALFVLIFAAAASADHQISVTALPAVPGLRCSAIDVNDAGDVLVSCTTNTLAGPPAVAYVWSNGVRTDITGPADISGCVGINNAKQVACNTYSSTPFLWQNGTVTSLAPGMRSVSALNDLGEVSGGTNVGGANGLRRANGTIVTAPTSLFLFGFASSGGLNNVSQVPARPATTPLYDTVGTWSPAAGYVVADKGWDFLAGINDAGQMAAELQGNRCSLRQDEDGKCYLSLLDTPQAPQPRDRSTRRARRPGISLLKTTASSAVKPTVCTGYRAHFRSTSVHSSRFLRGPRAVIRQDRLSGRPRYRPARAFRCCGWSRVFRHHYHRHHRPKPTRPSSGYLRTAARRPDG